MKFTDTHRHWEKCHFDGDLRFYAGFQGSRVDSEDWLEGSTYRQVPMRCHSWHRLGIDSLGHSMESMTGIVLESRRP